MSPMFLVSVSLAAWYVSWTLTRLHGPFGLAERLRHRVMRWRGFERNEKGRWVRATSWYLGREGGPAPATEVDTTSDWLVQGIHCPVCASLWVAPVVLALAATPPLSLLVDVLALAGAASVLSYALTRPSKG